MNIFKYQGQEEDHYTNILMNILSLNDCQLVEPFLENLIADRVDGLIFKNINVYLRKKYCPQEHQKLEFIIGIAPYENAISEHNKLEENLDSIPDAWICGENFNILLEFKIRGYLDENQISAHRKLLKNPSDVIRITWEDVLDSLEKCNIANNLLYSFLIEQFIEVSQNFREKRRSSGMPPQIISNKREDNLYFIITGSREIGIYTVDKVENQKNERLINNLTGIQSARRWIANYVLENYSNISIEYNGYETIISDYCVVPGRPVKKNQWNQWRIGAILGKVERGD
ncbi:hypothetical protein ACNQFZ_08665 [Schinkia sp. CFF1]